MTKALIKNNIALNAHKDGLQESFSAMISSLKEKKELGNKPLNVLIIGGSSGYGFATRVALAEKNNAKTINVSYERDGNSPSAGYFNNQLFNEHYEGHKDFNGDCFSHEMKQHVIDYIKSEGMKIDMLVYSVASGVRIDPDTQEKYMSALKPIGQTYQGWYVDIAKETMRITEIEPANDTEIANTTKVMGGEDYALWVDALHEAQVFNTGAIALTYTYVGSPLTEVIYKHGTIGFAKRDLETKHQDIKATMQSLGGTAYISASKTVVTKASVFIPGVATYASALFKVMKTHGTHETVLEHKYRLLDGILNQPHELPIDEDDLVRIDAHELDKKTQEAVKALLEQVNETNFKDVLNFDYFKDEFLKINGFSL